MHYDGKRFRLTENAVNGEVDQGTLFAYRQDGEVLTGTYSGGGVRLGQILGRVREDGSLEFLYQHLNEDGVLRNGRCESVPELLPDGRLRLRESWEWSGASGERGNSVIEEI
jgi:hypothetical protein